MESKAEKKAIVDMMLRGKTQAQIAKELDLTEVTVRKLQREIVEQFHDHYATNTDWWLEKIAARYEMLWGVIAPFAEMGAKDYLKLANETLKGMQELVGADASSRQRDKALSLAARKVESDIQMNIIDRYKDLMEQARPKVEYAPDHSPLGLPSGNDDERVEDEAEDATEIYEDAD